MTSFLGSVTFNGLIDVSVPVLASLLSLAFVGALVATLVALLYRWYVRERVPTKLALLFGLGTVAISLNTATTLGKFMGGQTEILNPKTQVMNLATLALAGVASVLGARLGDRIVTDIEAVSGVGSKRIDTEISSIVQSVGRVITVKIPELDKIEDIDGYDPVDEKIKASLGDSELVFPRRLTVSELRDRLVERIKEDYGVGHVDVEFDDKARIEYLAVGSRISGIGPTLPPGRVAVAVRADPAFTSSPGDVVQIWRRKKTEVGDAPETEDAEPSDEDFERVATGEVRGTSGEVVTVSVDSEDAEKLETDDSTQYRLITLPTEKRSENEFASLLRAADETVGSIEVTEGSQAKGLAVGALDITVVAIRTQDDQVEAIPPRSRVLNPGETVYVVARPDEIRNLERLVGTLD